MFACDIGRSQNRPVWRRAGRVIQGPDGRIAAPPVPALVHNFVRAARPGGDFKRLGGAARSAAGSRGGRLPVESHVSHPTSREPEPVDPVLAVTGEDDVAKVELPSPELIRKDRG